MNAPRPRRSALYLPASNARAIEKSRALPCDVVILDLEDAVAPDMKALARDQAVAAVSQGGFGRRELVVRVNGLDTPWGADDLRALADVGAEVALAPKVSSAEDVHAYDRYLGGATSLWVMIETCASLFALREIAAASRTSRLRGWVLGANDLAKEMRAQQTPDRTSLQGLLPLTVAAARAGGLIILDGVYNKIDDLDGLDRQCVQGRQFGFDGKTLIHPSQIDGANAAFSPDAESVAWAHAVVEAFSEPSAAGKGAIRIGGSMVERLHLGEARTVLEIAQAISEAEPA